MSDWIEWNGGECPVPPGTRVEVRLKAGTEDDSGWSDDWDWSDCGGHAIVAYRIIEEDKPVTEKQLDFTKPITTRDGRKVRILCTDGPNTYHRVVGFIEGNCRTLAWTLQGYYHDEQVPSNEDLVNPPVKRRGWAAIIFLAGEAKHYALYSRIFENKSEAGEYGIPVELPEWSEPA